MTQLAIPSSLKYFLHLAFKRSYYPDFSDSLTTVLWFPSSSSTIKQWSTQDSFPGPLAFLSTLTPLMISFLPVSCHLSAGRSRLYTFQPRALFDLYTHLFNFTQHLSASLFMFLKFARQTEFPNWIVFPQQMATSSSWAEHLKQFRILFFLSHPTSNVSASPVGSTLLKIRVRLWPHLAPHPACCQLRGHCPRLLDYWSLPTSPFFYCTCCWECGFNAAARVIFQT